MDTIYIIILILILFYFLYYMYNSNIKNSDFVSSLVIIQPDRIYINKLIIYKNYYPKQLYYSNPIKKCMFINLDKSKDRNISIKTQLNLLMLDYTRVQAIEFKSNGSKGCSLSHCKMIELAIENNYENCLFLEDDFLLSVSVEYFYKKINEFLHLYENNWDVLMLCGWNINSEKNPNNINKVLKSQTSCAFLVNNKYYNTLLKSFRLSATNLFDYKDNLNINKYSCDVTWFELQKKDRWYIIEPLMVKGDRVYSEIALSNVNYFNVPSIICNLEGRLGNNLFQIANAYFLAKKYGKFLIIVNNNNDNLQKIYHNIYKKNYIKNIIDSLDINTKKINQYEFNYTTEIILDYQSNYNIHGYYQSELFFVNIKEIIPELFHLDVKDYTTMLRLYNTYTMNFENKDIIISIHIRKTDYDNNKRMTTLPLSYYKQCIEYFGINSNYLIFSDDIEWCKKENMFNTLQNKNFIIEKDYIELFLMAQCTHNIIANSTFSWWGAYLNKNLNKTVLYPNQWFRSNTILTNNNTICPLEWTKIYIKDITIVTAYFRIDISKHSTTEYNNWMINTLNINYPMIIYIFKNDVETKNIILDTRQFLLDITTIKEIGLEDFYVYKYYNEFSNFQHNINPEKNIHNPYLYMIYNEKCSLVRKSIQENPYNSDIFMWIDIGYIREIRHNFLYNNININKIDKNNILRQSVPNKSYSYKVPTSHIICGGIFVGYKEPMLIYINNFYNTLDNYIVSKKFGGDDQIIATSIKNGVIDMYNKKEDWFFLFWYLNS